MRGKRGELSKRGPESLRQGFVGGEIAGWGRASVRVRGIKIKTYSRPKSKTTGHRQEKKTLARLTTKGSRPKTKKRHKTSNTNTTNSTTTPTTITLKRNKHDTIPHTKTLAARLERKHTSRTQTGPVNPPLALPLPPQRKKKGRGKGSSFLHLHRGESLIQLGKRGKVQLIGSLRRRHVEEKPTGFGGGNRVLRQRSRQHRLLQRLEKAVVLLPTGDHASESQPVFEGRVYGRIL